MAAVSSSSGMCGTSETSRRKSSSVVRASASCSSDASSYVGDGLDLGAQVGLFLEVAATRMRSMPWTISRTVPSGVRSMRWTMAAVPTRIHLVGRRLLHFGVLRGKKADDALIGRFRQRVIHQADGALLADRQRQPHHGVDHHPAQRQDRQLGRDREFGSVQCLAWANSFSYSSVVRTGTRRTCALGRMIFKKPSA